MNMEQAFQTFLAESTELLQDMENKLLGFDNCDDPAESVNSIFRAVHTIKGSAGLFGLDDIVAFTHVVESVLDEVRSGSFVLDEPLINLLLQCKDYIGKMVDSIDGEAVLMAPEDLPVQAALEDALFAYLNTEHSTSAATALVGIDDADNYQSVSVIESDSAMANENWHISVYFGADVLRNGMDPLSFLRYLATLGDIVHIETVTDDLPGIEDMDAESCYLGYEINFHSSASKSQIEDVFEFVREDCQLKILPPYAKVSDFIEIIDNIQNDELKLGEILVRCGTLTQRELDNLLQMQNAVKEGGTHRLIGEIVVEDGLASSEVVTAALHRQAQGKKAKEKQAQTVRVDAEKLDHLINLIGELVIASAGIESETHLAGIASLVESAQTMTRLVEEVRESALNLRMVQIGETFNRFQRVVRDVSKELGKDIDLQIDGADTELDKTVIEKISDPLMHLVRNSIDHGIESPALRSQRNKPATGNVKLNAYHESGTIVIEVSDDGGGLNREKILQKARANGLVSAEAELSAHDINQLIFEAGFSTAEAVSNISGRGVGMDVVRRNIEALRGTVEIDSEYTVGTTIRIRLPLTLAIIDGFMMKVGDAFYVVPLDIVEECIELNANHSVGHDGRSYINLRGEVLPFIRLGDYFCQSGSNAKRENIVVIKYGSLKAGFVVDELMGEFQTVIKPLGPLFERVPGISGSTILGSGEVALILDASSLIHLVMQRDGKAISAAAQQSALH
ncbi:chemotaxis protein CheA [Rheinheimera sp. EpRS3]|uniref:chemotaxis protein CheA n=1 Tax=Rheinheimera sp. EpRS3 TaxID=1712383 RepID=UPI00074ACF06|nr:chemotaxis protein CheA [Rheinheimera sp. EpRS3]KUM55202.1 chemotaxis protein CheA [Rheinheimera sp. EpRS3]